ncbi:hypothetical protein F5Y16DRAFT_389221 [Xylariaceae sp. FL0255]|nr:hypothetical protein F5Y16DRAFT_389221 [Xylariaceae sp. FL0255]
MDSTCGPSNAFKGLARHVEQDRSRQQDRFVGSSHLNRPQNFRSAPANLAVSGQFDAFQQNAPAPHLTAPQHQALQLLHAPPPPQAYGPAPPPAQQSTMQPSGWVNDFQRMNLSQPPAANSHQAHAPVLGSGMSRRAGASAHQVPHTSWSPFQALEPFQTFQPQPSSFMMPPGGGLQEVNVGPHASRLQNQLSEPHFNLDNQAQFDQEFESLMDDWMAQNAPQTESQPQPQEGDTLPGNLSNILPEAPQETTTETPLADTEDSKSELARAAQQLVESLADNDSDKFKNSEFLALMRRIASQQLTVEGNDLVESPRAPSAEA